MSLAGQYGALDLVQRPLWIFDIDRSRVFWANAAALAVWNAESLAELCARDMGKDMSGSVARRLKQYQSDFIARAASFNEQWTLYPNGLPVSLNVRYSGHRLDDGRMAMFCEAHPIDEVTPESLRSVEALLHTDVMITLYGNDGRALYRNPAARAAVVSPDETLAQRFGDINAYGALQAELAQQGTATRTLFIETTMGKRWHELSLRLCRDAVTGQDATLVSEVDISAIKSTEERANFLSLHDSLTGLPNRNHVMQHFDVALSRFSEDGREAALVFIDLDHFKDVNDTLGHAAGDELLVQTAKRLRHSIRGTDLVARLGGDEFLILLAAMDVRTEVDRVRTRLMHSIAQPVAVAGTEVQVTPSMGVAMFPRDGSDVETLLRHADLALYTAKSKGRNDLAFYEENMSDAVRKRLELEAELRHAIDREEFVVYYQPRINVATGQIVGAEALVRWRHPQHGLVAPDQFIPTCESTGLIRPLGNFVMLDALRQQARWQSAGHDLKVSVNLSARQLTNPELLDEVKGLLRQTGGHAGALEVEITESMLLDSDSRLLDLMREFELLGIAIALDDFGTGYSNLAYLQRFPIHTLKIDRSFIQTLDTYRPLTEVIVSMCRVLNYAAVAEGVETQEQLAWVSSLGIQQYQGFLFSPALPVEQFDTLLEDRSRLKVG